MSNEMSEGGAYGRGCKRMADQVDGVYQAGAKRQQRDAVVGNALRDSSTGISDMVACLGKGPCWDVSGGFQRGENSRWEKEQKESGEIRALRDLSKRLLEQALSCSRHADVRFELDDGTRPVWGHRSVLCCASEVFGRMFGSGVKEDEADIVRIGRGVGAHAVRGLLEWLYRGRAGDECKTADGRELWALAEMYEVCTMRAWLVEEGVSSGNVCSACEFALASEGDRAELVEACCRVAMGGLNQMGGKALVGIGGAAAMKLLSSFLSVGSDGAARVREGFQFVEVWWSVNELRHDASSMHLEGLLGLLDLTRLDFSELREIVKPSGLLSPEHLHVVYEQKCKAEAEARARSYRSIRTFGGKGEGHGEFSNLFSVCVHGNGAEQRVAAVDKKGFRVHVFNVDSGACVQTFGSEGTGPGQLKCPSGLAFGPQGELLVVDYDLGRIQVFGRDGALLRSFGQAGTQHGQFHQPVGIASAPGGGIIVVDRGNHRVQMFEADGTFVRSFGCEGTGDGQLCFPTSVAVGHDGSIAVSDFKNARVQVFDAEGRFVRVIGTRGKGPGQLLKPHGVALGAAGDVFVSDWKRNDVQVFSREGQLVRSIGKGKECDFDLESPNGLAVDDLGRLFAASPDAFHVKMLF